MPDKNRREFIKKSTLAAFSAALGTEIVFGDHLPVDLLPIGLQNDELVRKFGKNPDLTVLNDRPWNVETPPHLLDDPVTPASNVFMRNNGRIPSDLDPSTWILQIDGESVVKPLDISLNDLKDKFQSYTYQLVIECGGNGRAEYYPPAKGNQWTTGAVCNCEWTGVRLKDVLEEAGINTDAVYVAYYGIDTHLSGDPDKVVISRGIPIEKALEDETLLAFKMNGKDIPIAHGFPLRLVVGGWPGSVSGKWINRIRVRNIIHDGPKMTGDSYRVPCEPVAPGTTLKPEDMCIIESMPVKSLITYPKTGAVLQNSGSLSIRGHAWAGDYLVKKVEYSIDFGATWSECQLDNPPNRLAWQRFSARVNFPRAGYYEVWARATDERGISQPMIVPGWNPKGYLNNACHRIAVKVL